MYIFIIFECKIDVVCVIQIQSMKMDYKEPKTRQETNRKQKDKQVYNQKTIRLRESMIEKTKSKRETQIKQTK